MKTLNEDDHAAVTELLLGRTIKKVDDDTLLLDNGTTLKFFGHEGGCSCSAGDYDLTELNGVDNIITNVEFKDSPSGDYMDDGEGVYQIFVYADNQKVNLATFEGTDGNGYYGTGYYIEIYAPGENEIAGEEEVEQLTADSGPAAIEKN